MPVECSNLLFKMNSGNEKIVELLIQNGADMHASMYSFRNNNTVQQSLILVFWRGKNHICTIKPFGLQILNAFLKFCDKSQFFSFRTSKFCPKRIQI